MYFVIRGRRRYVPSEIADRGLTTRDQFMNPVVCSRDKTPLNELKGVRNKLKSNLVIV